MVSRSRSLRTFLLVALFLLPVFAQNTLDDKVDVRLSHASISLDQTATLTITVTGLADSVDIPTPQTNDGGLQFTPTGRRYSMSSINGQMTSSLQYDFVITPMRTGRHVIEPISGTIAGLPFTTPSQRLEVTQGSGLSSQPGATNPYSNNPLFGPGSNPWPTRPSIPMPREDDVVLEASLEPEVVFVHQPSYYNLKLLTAVNLLSDPRYNPVMPTGFLRVPFEQKNGEDYRAGRYYQVNSVATAFFPLSEGTYTFPSTDVQVTTSAFALPKVLRTGNKDLKVLPLPSENRPSSFTGAVGETFEIRANLKTQRISLEQSAELEITVKGDGHLDLVPYPYLPDWKDLDKKQSSSPSTTTVENEQIVSRRTYNFRLKPKKAGTYKLSGIALGYFNPREERYETLKAETLVLLVDANSKGGAADQADEMPTAATSEADAPKTEPGSRYAIAPELPRGSLALGLTLLALGVLLVRSNGGLSLGRPWGRPKRAVPRRHQTLEELLQTLQGLASGTDTDLRARQLGERGWTEQAVERYESLRLRATKALFGSVEKSGATLADLDTELQALCKENRA